MQQLTFKNALADTVNFANNVKLPFDNTTKSSPQNAVCFALSLSRLLVASVSLLKFYQTDGSFDTALDSRWRLL